MGRKYSELQAIREHIILYSKGLVFFFFLSESKHPVVQLGTRK